MEGTKTAAQPAFRQAPIPDDLRAILDGALDGSTAST